MAQAPLPVDSINGDFNEHAFKERVSKALERVRTITENTRTPTIAYDVHHEYEDKFLLAEFIGNTTIASIMQILEAIGITEKIFQLMKEWPANRSVTLRFKAEETCKFLRKTVREVESDTKLVSKSTVFGTRETFTVTKITEWFWNFEARYELSVFMGNEPDKRIVLMSRSSSIELKTAAETTPRPESVVRPNIDANISWLLAHVTGSGREPTFTINRTAKSCHTPRRNGDVAEALQGLSPLFGLCAQVHAHFTRNVWPVDTNHGLDLSAVKDTGLFVPVIPLFDETLRCTKAGGSGSGVVPVAYIGQFITEQRRSINEKLAELAKILPADGLIAAPDAKLLVMLLHLQKVCRAFAEGVDSIENMLHKQLVAAIGKEVHPLDFANYMRFHGRKLFRADFVPRAFSYAIRREGHDPEGTLSIEAAPVDNSIAEPIHTLVRHAPHAREMKFALDASTEVRFGGDRFLHGYVSFQFGNQVAANLTLRARARQFSSFILLVGSIASADLFIPKYGIIVQNKDELSIPLDLETIPTPKEFKDAIESLSSEQQRFAQAYRSMQVASTLFGVCVIQIKPQLERLLKLPPDSLTKEIALATDLQKLFMEYQLPSDLLSYDGDSDAPASAKVARVKQLVAEMNLMINKEKEEQLRQEKQRLEMKLAEERKAREEHERRIRREEERRLREEEERRAYEMEKRKRMEEMERRKCEEERVHRESYRREAESSSRHEEARRAEEEARLAKIEARRYELEAERSRQVASAPVAAATPGPISTPTPTPVMEHPQRAVVTESEAEDFTKVPQEMEQRFEMLDDDSALRPTIIKAGEMWTHKFQKSLLSATESRILRKDEHGKERNRAFDLLDSITKSGVLSIAEADLHVVIASTHCFEKTLMNTVVQDNVNPIEKVERSALIVGSTVHRRPASALIQEDQVARVSLYSPKLIDGAAAPMLACNNVAK